MCPPAPPAGDTGSLHAASHDSPCDDLSSHMANRPTHHGSQSDFHNKSPERLKSFRVSEFGMGTRCDRSSRLSQARADGGEFGVDGYHDNTPELTEMISKGWGSGVR